MESKVKTDISRKGIKELLPPSVTFSIRKVDFTDLARGQAYDLKIKRGDEELPEIFFGDSHRDGWLDVIMAKNRIKANHTYKGCTIL